MAAGADDESPLVEESTAAIIPVSGAGSYLRSARFLLPRAAAGKPPSPAAACAPAPDADDVWVEFHGWAGSPELWRRWVEKLRPRHEALWRKVGILDGVLASADGRVLRHDAVLLQLAAFWSGGTSSFVFPWGEATVTLEDVAVLAGLPVLGAPVTAQLPGTLAGDVAALQAIRTGSKKAYEQARWARHFLEQSTGMEEEKGEEDDADVAIVEHGAFLATWLSLYALPAPPFKSVRPELFPVAARLARGKAVALAPAALASIYNDLTALRHYLDAVSVSGADDGRPRQPFVSWAPLHIVLLWVWERFPKLRPAAIAGVHGAPRAARWHNARKMFDAGYIRAMFMSPVGFEWRPYGSSSGFAMPMEKAGCWVHGRDIGRSRELMSFARCLRPCELVGLRCIEQYLPHRVARQLGFDQDMPGFVARANSNSTVAWATYKMDPQGVKFIVPCHELGGVTVEYKQWWECNSLASAVAVANSGEMEQPPVVDSSRKRMAEGSLDGESSKRRHLEETGVPPSDNADEREDEIPLIDRLNGVIMRMNRNSLKGTDPVKFAEIVKDLVLRWVKDGGKGSPLHENSEQALSDAEATLVTAVGESSCVSVNKDRRESLQQIEDKASDHVIAYDKKDSNSGHGKVKIDRPVDGAASAGSNEATEPAALVPKNSIPKDIGVISDDKFDEVLSGKEGRVDTMHLNSHQMETTKGILQEFDVKSKLLIIGNDEQGCQVLKEAVMQKICVDTIVISDDEADEVTHNEDEVDTIHLDTYRVETTNCTFEELVEKRELVITGNGEQGNPLMKEAVMQNKCVDTIVISDDESDEVTHNEDEVDGHSKSSNLDRIASTLRESNEESKLVKPISDEQDSLVSKHIMPQSDCDYEGATMLNDITLRQELAEVTHVSTAQTNVHHMEGSTKEMSTSSASRGKEKRIKLDKKRFSTLEDDEKENQDTSVSNQEVGSHIDLLEVNKKGVRENSSSILVDGNAEQVKKVVSHKTIYYLRSFALLKDAQDRDAGGKNAHGGGFVPRWEVGTEEMVSEASEARRREMVELKAAIDGLKEKILQ
uniref:Aminotransferase-like plant mobile domain-containing protein n=1 Tax=Leersia perrieri TaxID=77586 RepID=A0A0D9XY91_9ORYZ